MVHLWQWGAMTSHHKSPLKGQMAYAARVWVFVFAMHEYIRGRGGSVVDIAFLWCIVTSAAMLCFECRGCRTAWTTAVQNDPSWRCWSSMRRNSTVPMVPLTGIWFLNVNSLWLDISFLINTAVSCQKNPSSRPSKVYVKQYQGIKFIPEMQLQMDSMVAQYILGDDRNV